ncbi:MAG: hypothetical protein SPL73_07710 [Cyanobacteriota bacterium]|nr:hypothetical protein [Cyanobacteriota bacterium]MDY6358192.1 hypothetical protein [Cyanobacteriota bacterium]MDY6364756.1 hypothetical protein [Cyanobacteriota bacterium]MDY6383126.1 hypothetical protein [Cyanobacteriota bacterium]
MNIAPVLPSYITSFGALVPLKDYKGEILKLTKAEKERIAALEQSITELDIERAQYIFLEGKYIGRSISYTYHHKADHLSWEIDNLRDEIKAIKTNRLNARKQAKV